MKVKFWSVPKYEGQNEDHWHVPDDPESPIVLCDGASESFNSRLWAELLSKGLTKHENFTDSWLKSKIVEYERTINPDELSWSKRLAYERGSFSTFLSVQIRDGKCFINAVGDTEVFLVAGGRIKSRYPYAYPHEFLSHPCLLSTKVDLNKNLGELVEDCPFSGEFRIEDATHILLLTDAIAHWLLKRENNQDAVIRLLEINTDADFYSFVENERKNDLRIDDTTMIRIDLRDCLPMIYHRNQLALIKG